MNKTKIYWLCSSLQPQHKQKALLLEKHGYEVSFFVALESLMTALSKQRVPIIIIGNEGDENTVEKNIIYLSKRPEVQGTRLILSISKRSLKIETIAACSAFRDIIPLDIADTHWLNRFIFATSKSKIEIPSPIPQFTINNISSVAIPARITLIGVNKIFVEARINPKEGSILNLTGAFVRSIGLNSLSLTVNKVRHTDLVFRFSSCIEAQWNIPENKKAVVFQLLNKMQETNFGPRCKVFVAAQTPELRNAIIKELDPLRFDLNVALKKQSIVDEPKYFSPKIVFIEDKLCTKEEFPRFQQMLASLDNDVTVCIIGTNISKEELSQINPAKKIIILHKLPEKLPHLIFTKYLSPQKLATQHIDAVYIPPDHPFSIAELNISARLTLVHPIEIQLLTSTKLENFGLCRIDSPWLKKILGWTPYAKIKNSHTISKNSDDTFKNILECYLADLSKDEQMILADKIIEFASSSLKATFTLKPSSETTNQTELQQTQPTTQKHLSSDIIPTEENTAIKPQLLQKAQILDNEIDGEQIHLDEIIKKAHVSLSQSISNIVASIFSPGFKAFVLFLILSAIILGLIYSLVTVIAPSWHKSGAQYSEFFKKFGSNKLYENYNNNNK